MLVAVQLSKQVVGALVTGGSLYVIGTTADSFQELPWPYQVTALEMTQSW